MSGMTPTDTFGRTVIVSRCRSWAASGRAEPWAKSLFFEEDGELVGSAVDDLSVFGAGIERGFDVVVCAQEANPESEHRGGIVAGPEQVLGAL